MKKGPPVKFIFPLIIIFSALTSLAQNPVNWTDKQLIEPSELAKEISSQKDLPVIISVGPGAVIPGSIDIGMVNNKQGLKKFKNQLSNLPKETRVVIYCGCCPFEHCPNVRPAIDVLKQLEFTDYYLLNLVHNIKTDWIDKGYPVSK